MIFARAVRIAGRIAAVTSIILFANSARSDGIPKAELAKILGAESIPTPWHVVQVAYNNQGPHWQVDVYYNQRQPANDMCVVSVSTFIVSAKDGTYAIEGTQSLKQLALDRCDNVKKLGEFADLTGSATDAQLVAAARAALAASGYKLSSGVRLQSEELRPLLQYATRYHLHGVVKQGSDITLKFRVDEIWPDVLAIQVGNDGKGPIYVYRGNGPDLAPTGEKR